MSRHSYGKTSATQGRRFKRATNSAESENPGNTASES